MFDKQARFDWYQATVPASVALLQQTLDNCLDLDVPPRPVPPRFGYKKGLSWHLEETAEDLALMFWGGHNLHPHVLATSDRAPALAGHLAYVFPDHRVSRADVCVDLSEEGLFDRGAEVFAAVHRRFSRVQFTRYGPGRDDHTGDVGRTLYLGSPSSPVRLVWYEKGFEQYSRTGDRVWIGVPEFRYWTRLEIRCRPEKHFKAQAATLKPHEFFGVTAWAREVAQGILNLKAEPISMKPTRIADQERAMRALSTQYGQVLQRQIERLGETAAWDDLKRRIGLDLPEAA